MASKNLLDFIGIRYLDSLVSGGISGYVTSAELEEVRRTAEKAYHFKGTVPEYSDLPASGNSEGDVWNVGPDLNGGNYAWTLVSSGASVWGEWDKLGETVDLTPYVTFSQYANQLSAGLMSPTDKAKLDNIDPMAVNVNVDPSLNSASTNPVRNNAVAAALDGKLNRNVVATSQSNGAMAASDWLKLSGIAESANYFVLSAANATTLGGVVVDSRLDTTVSSGGAIPDGEVEYHVVQNAVVHRELGSKIGRNAYASASSVLSGGTTAWVGVSDGTIRASDYAKLQSIDSGAKAYGPANASTLGLVIVDESLDADIPASQVAYHVVQNAALKSAIDELSINPDNYVPLASNCTIGGVKTFTSDIIGNISGIMVSGVLTSGGTAAYAPSAMSASAAAVATALSNPCVISLAGDASGACTPDFDGTSDVVISAAIPVYSWDAAAGQGVKGLVPPAGASGTVLKGNGVWESVGAAIGDAYVHLYGTGQASDAATFAPETIHGVKTFTTAPVVPDAASEFTYRGSALVVGKKTVLAQGSASSTFPPASLFISGMRLMAPLPSNFFRTYIGNGIVWSPVAAGGTNFSGSAGEMLMMEEWTGPDGSGNWTTACRTASIWTLPGGSSAMAGMLVAPDAGTPCLVGASSFAYEAAVFSGDDPTSYPAPFPPVSRFGNNSKKPLLAFVSKRQDEDVYETYYASGGSWIAVPASTVAPGAASQLFIPTVWSPYQSGTSTGWTSETQNSLISFTSTADVEISAGATAHYAYAVSARSLIAGGALYSSVDNSAWQEDAGASGDAVAAASQVWVNDGSGWTSSSEALQEAVNARFALGSSYAYRDAANLDVAKGSDGGTHAVVNMPPYQLADLFPSVWPSPSSGTPPVHRAFYGSSSDAVKCICMGKHLASVSGGTMFTCANADPSIGRNRNDAFSACSAAGVKLNSNDNWAARALWLYRQNGSSYAYRGNTASGSCYDAKWQTGVSGTGGATLTGTGPMDWSDNGDADGMTDLFGNLWEVVDGVRVVDGEIQMLDGSDWKCVLGDGTLAAPSTAGAMHFYAAGGAILIGASSGGTGVLSGNFSGISADASVTSTASALFKETCLMPIEAGQSGPCTIPLAGTAYLCRGCSYKTGASAGLFGMKFVSDNEELSDVGFRITV